MCERTGEVRDPFVFNLSELQLLGRVAAGVIAVESISSLVVDIVGPYCESTTIAATIAATIKSGEEQY